MTTIDDLTSGDDLTPTAIDPAELDAPLHYRLRPPTPGRLVAARWDRRHNPPRAVGGRVALGAPVTCGVLAMRGLYAVTESMRAVLAESDLTGFTFGPLVVDTDVTVTGHPDEFPRLHTLVLTGRACRTDIAPWRCDSLALSQRAAVLMWRHDPVLHAATSVLEVLGLPD